MAINEKRYRGQRILSWICYGLALGIGIGGVIGTIYLEIAAINLGPMLASFQFLAGPLINLVARPIASALSYLGLAVLLISLAISAVLFGCGKLTARQVELSARVDQLEQQLAHAEKHAESAPAGSLG